MRYAALLRRKLSRPNRFQILATFSIVRSLSHLRPLLAFSLFTGTSSVPCAAVLYDHIFGVLHSSLNNEILIAFFRYHAVCLPRETGFITKVLEGEGAKDDKEDLTQGTAPFQPAGTP